MGERENKYQQMEQRSNGKQLRTVLLNWAPLMICYCSVCMHWCSITERKVIKLQLCYLISYKQGVKVLSVWKRVYPIESRQWLWLVWYFLFSSRGGHFLKHFLWCQPGYLNGILLQLINIWWPLVNKWQISVMSLG